MPKGWDDVEEIVEDDNGEDEDEGSGMEEGNSDAMCCSCRCAAAAAVVDVDLDVCVLCVFPLSSLIFILVALVKELTSSSFPMVWW